MGLKASNNPVSFNITFTHFNFCRISSGDQILQHNHSSRIETVPFYHAILTHGLCFIENMIIAKENEICEVDVQL